MLEQAERTDTVETQLLPSPPGNEAQENIEYEPEIITVIN